MIILPYGSAYPNSPTVIKGTIRNNFSRAPVAGAEITLQNLIVLHKQVSLLSGLSGVNGDYEISAFLQSGLYLLRCRANGYKTYSKIISLASAGVHAQDIRLFPDKNNANRPPLIRSISPAEGREFMPGAKVLISVSALDPEGGPLNYRFFVNGIEAQGWAKPPEFIWQTKNADKGEFLIRCEARDKAGLIGSGNVKYNLIMPQARDLLNKVKANYARIADFSALMRFESESGLPSTKKVVNYCRYFFKAPDKERTETFNTPKAIGRPSEVIIVTADKMILQAGDTREEVDLKADFAESASDPALFNICYNQEAFIAGHNLRVNPLISDPLNLIVALGAEPMQETDLYEKLQLRLDYNKGLVSGYEIYVADSSERGFHLFQNIKVLASKQVFPGAWLPVSMQKTIFLTGGNIISKVEYSQIKVNSGLSDELFK